MLKLWNKQSINGAFGSRARHFSLDSVDWFDVEKESKFNFLSHKSIITAVVENILYKNEHIMVINKPKYLPVFTPPGSSFPSIETVAHKLGAKLKKEQILTSTRLSSLYSGLVILSFNDEANKFIGTLLIESSRHRKPMFSDVVITVGCPKEASGIIKGKEICKTFYDFVGVESAQHKLRRGVINYNTIKCNHETAAALLKLNLMGGLLDHGLISMASILNPVLGDNTYSQLIGYLHNIPFLLPENAKISQHRTQILPYNTRLALNLPKTTSKEEVPLHAHRHRMKLPKSEFLGLSEDTAFVAPPPHSFLLTAKLLNLYDEEVKSYFCSVA